ncbi:MAG: septum formation initiator family protein, partial [Candidatus Schekmanbacteria bacterium]
RTSIRKKAPKFCLLIFITYFFLIAYLFFGTDNGYFKIKKLEQREKYLENKISYLKRENQELREKIRMAQTDPFWIEKLGREELDLVRDGEIVFKIMKQKR